MTDVPSFLYEQTCDHCAELDPSQPAPAYLSLFGIEGRNRELIRSEEFVLMADASPMSVGHLLLCSVRHDWNMAATATRAPQAFLSFVSQSLQPYEQAFGPAVILEHGSTPGHSESNSCIDHAHLHILPFGRDELLPLILRDHPEIEVQAFTEPVDVGIGTVLRRVTDAPYLLYVSGAHRFLTQQPELLYHQYARSVVARREGLSDPSEWDWAVHPRKDLLESTLALYRAHIST